MSDIIITLIFIVSVWLVCMFFLWIERHRKLRNRDQLLDFFGMLGTKYQLMISGQEVLQNCVIGIDGRNEKILVLQKAGDYFSDVLINLNEIKRCEVTKVYAIENMSELSQSRSPERIDLFIEFHDGREGLYINFYKQIEDGLPRLKTLERKARYWEAMLLKMLRPFTPIRA